MCRGAVEVATGEYVETDSAARRSPTDAELSAALIRISGSMAALEHGLVKDGATPFGGVPFSERDWCRVEFEDGHSDRWEISRSRP